MIFAHTWRQVLLGTKTQTRRLVSIPGEFSVCADHDWKQIIGVCHGDRLRFKWQVSHSYAVQPHRNHPALLYCPHHPCYGIDIIEPFDSHYQLAKDGSWNWQGQGYKRAEITLTRIRRERLQDISFDDALAEIGEELCLDCDRHIQLHRSGVPHFWSDDDRIDGETPRVAFMLLWDSIHIKPGKRWEDNPFVWVLEWEPLGKEQS